MYTIASISKYRDVDTGTWLMIKVPEHIGAVIRDKKIQSAELRLDDGRFISALQRKKAYATIRDIALYTGYPPEECKELMKYNYMISTGRPYFSLSDCTMDEARQFIDYVLDFSIEEGIPLSEPGVMRADDVGKYLYSCIKHKKCAVCGRDGEIHHVDAIGMGRDRKTVDDTGCRKICLCRNHHIIAHAKGMRAFEAMYHVYGLRLDEQ